MTNDQRDVTTAAAAAPMVDTGGQNGPLELAGHANGHTNGHTNDQLREATGMVAAGSTHKGVRVGSTAEFSKTITEHDVELFAELSGDHNPVHLDEEYAKKTRFHRTIVHGIYTSGLISAALAMKLAGPDKTVIYLNQNLKFLKPVYHGDTITAKIEVTDLDEVKRIAKVRTDCFNQKDEQVVAGEAVILLDEYPK